MNWRDWLALGAAGFVLISAAHAQVPPPQQPPPPPSEVDLCQRQLNDVHVQADTTTRMAFQMQEKLKAAQTETASVEARLATALEWVKAAQAETRKGDAK